MGTKLSAHDEELYRRTDEVLHYVWDPIGVSGAPEARDEYYSYLPQVFALLRAGAAPEQLAAHLEESATVSMGLEGNLEHTLKVVKLLLRWKAVLHAKYAPLS